MAKGGLTPQPVDHIMGTEILSDLAEAAVGMELLAVIGDHPCRFLATVLQRVQAEGGVGSRILMAEDPKQAALIMWFVRVKVERQGLAAAH
jgi:hypothetical protein